VHDAALADQALAQMRADKAMPARDQDGAVFKTRKSRIGLRHECPWAAIFGPARDDATGRTCVNLERRAAAGAHASGANN
jgi:hypothetical protein